MNLYPMFIRNNFSKKITSRIDWSIVRFSSTYKTLIQSCKLKNKDKQKKTSNQDNKSDKIHHHHNKDHKILS